MFSASQLCCSRGAIIRHSFACTYWKYNARGLRYRPKRYVSKEEEKDSILPKETALMESRFKSASDWRRVARLHQHLGREDNKTRERGEKVARNRLLQLFTVLPRKNERSALVEAAQQLHPNLLEPVAVCAAEQLDTEHPLADDEVGFVLFALGNRVQDVSPATLKAVDMMAEHVRENIDSFGRRALFMSVVGASCIGRYDMSALLATVEAYFDADRLKGVRPRGLVDLATAAGRHKHQACAQKLLCRLSEAFLLRLPDFQPSEAVMALRALSFGKAPLHQDLKETVEQYFVRLTPSLSNADLSRLAEALLGFNWTHVQLREEIFTRASSLQLRQLVTLVRYVTHAKKMDAGLLRQLAAILPRFNLKLAHPKEIGYLLEILSHRAISSSHVSTTVGHDLAKIVNNRLEEFSSGRCARLVRSLNELQIASVELLEKLYDRVSFSSLTCDEFVWLVYGLSLSEEGRAIGRNRLPNEKYNLQMGSLAFGEVVLLAKGLRRLCLAHHPWVSVLVQYAEEKTGSVSHSSVMMAASLFIELSLLNADFKQPLGNLCRWIDDEEGPCTLPISTSIRLLSAAAGQGILPRCALRLVFECSQDELLSLELFEKQFLLALAAIVKQQVPANPTLPSESSKLLRECLISELRSLPLEVKRCLKRLSALLTRQLICEPFITHEGFLLHGALLHDGSKCCAWGGEYGMTNERSSKELVSMGVQPVAVLVVPRKHCDCITGLPLGQLRLLCQALSVHGWGVVTIPYVQWENAEDGDHYLLSRLSAVMEASANFEEK